MTVDLDLLEQRLLVLGSRELALTTSIRLLKDRMKAAVEAGNLDDADAAWELYEEARAELAPIVAEVSDIERVLYGHRRRQRR